MIISPTAINVEAFCSFTQQYYTIAQNYSVAKRTVVWDTEAYQLTGRPLIAQYVQDAVCLGMDGLLIVERFE